MQFKGILIIFLSLVQSKSFSIEKIQDLNPERYQIKVGVRILHRIRTVKQRLTIEKIHFRYEKRTFFRFCENARINGFFLIFTAKNRILILKSANRVPYSIKKHF